VKDRTAFCKLDPTIGEYIENTESHLLGKENIIWKSFHSTNQAGIFKIEEK
jgi:hypothetical protein